MTEWLGHYDSCPSQWGGGCPCGDEMTAWCASREPHEPHEWARGNYVYQCNGYS
jgi:hypothetical protein